MLDALASALVALSAGKTSAPPRIVAHAPGSGFMAAMVGYVPGAGLEAKLVSVFPQNHERGAPSHQAVITLFDEADGTPLALMDGSYITAMRTGGTAAVAARALAREDATVLAILGAGVQGGSHLETFLRVRDFAEIRVASRDAGKAAALAARHSQAHVATSFEAAVRGADVVACCTDAREPILLAASGLRPASMSVPSAAPSDRSSMRTRSPAVASSSSGAEAPPTRLPSAHTNSRASILTI